MDSKEQFKKVLDWMKQISRAVSIGQKELAGQIKSVESQLTDEIKSLESRLTERLDAHSGALQALLKAIHALRGEHHNNKIRLDKEIEKIKQEIRQRTT